LELKTILKYCLPKFNHFFVHCKMFPDEGFFRPLSLDPEINEIGTIQTGGIDLLSLLVLCDVWVPNFPGIHLIHLLGLH
jgi:hypothetical protein